MTRQPITPWEAARRFIEDLTVADIVWLVIAAGLVAFFYSVSTKQIRRDTGKVSELLLWFAVLAGWVFCFVVIGYPRIAGGGGWSWLTGFALSVVCFVIVAFLLRGESEWMQVLYGVVVISVGFSIAITFAIGAQAFSYSVIFGFMLGVALGMCIRSARRLAERRAEAPVAEKRADGWDFSKNTKV